MSIPEKKKKFVVKDYVPGTKLTFLVGGQRGDTWCKYKGIRRSTSDKLIDPFKVRI